MKHIKLVLLLILTASIAQAVQPADPARLDEVVARGVHVMPFDLDKTQHIFTKTETGGIQQVLAKDANDHKQIGLIREHLSALAKRFGLGDFSGPMRIHGDTMPGVQDLQTGFKQIHFNYQELVNGAQIAYVSTDPQLVAAVHQYFDAQLIDHARHAVPGAQHHGH